MMASCSRFATTVHLDRPCLYQVPGHDMTQCGKYRGRGEGVNWEEHGGDAKRVLLKPCCLHPTQPHPTHFIPHHMRLCVCVLCKAPIPPYNCWTAYTSLRRCWEMGMRCLMSSISPKSISATTTSAFSPAIATTFAQGEMTEECPQA